MQANGFQYLIILNTILFPGQHASGRSMHNGIYVRGQQRSFCPLCQCILLLHRKFLGTVMEQSTEPGLFRGTMQMFRHAFRSHHYANGMGKAFRGKFLFKSVRQRRDGSRGIKSMGADILLHRRFHKIFQGQTQPGSGPYLCGRNFTDRRKQRDFGTIRLRKLFCRFFFTANISLTTDTYQSGQCAYLFRLVPVGKRTKHIAAHNEI